MVTAASFPSSGPSPLRGPWAPRALTGPTCGAWTVPVGASWVRVLRLLPPLLRASARCRRLPAPAGSRRPLLGRGRSRVPRWCSSAGWGTRRWCSCPRRARPGSASYVAAGPGGGHHDVGRRAESVRGEGLALRGDDLGAFLPLGLGFPHRYIWPAELDLIGQLPGFELESRHADWSGAEFTADSRSHVSVYRLPPGP